MQGMDAQDSSNSAQGNAVAGADPAPVTENSPPAGLREDQIQNAVAFLSHPKVQGSPVSAKRSFLEKKGLTSAEIDEAFRRVPDAPATLAPAAPAPVVASSTAAPTYGANNLVTYTQQPSNAVLTGQIPASAAQTNALVPMQQHMVPPPQPLRWTQVVLGLGVAAASLYGLHQLLAPRVSHWASQLTASRRAAQEAEAARTAALTAALESLAQGQKQLLDSIEGLAAAVRQQQQQRPGSSQQGQRLGMYAAGGTDTSSISFAAGPTAEYLCCQSPGGTMTPAAARQGYSAAPNSMDSTAHDAASRAAAMRGWDPYADTGRSRAPRAAVYGTGDSSSLQQQAEAAGSSVVGVAAVPAGGFQVVPRSMQQATPAMHTTSSSSNMLTGHQAPAMHTTSSSSNMLTGHQAPDEAPHSAAFHEVMEMVRQGITPPNVRTDINDAPPDPSRPITAPQLAPRGKPWEHGGSSSSKAAPVNSSPARGVADNFMQQQQQHNGNGVACNDMPGYTHSPTAWEVPAASINSSQFMSNLETTASQARRKSLEGSVGYSLSHLLGADPGSSDVPWRPPPPPEPTVRRPNSSGSSSSRTEATAAASAPAAGVVLHSGEDVVATVTASAVQKVVAAVEAEASAHAVEAAV